MKDMFEEEIPAHRKKRQQKSVKKSDHKHDYSLYEMKIEDKMLGKISANERKYVSLSFICSICNKHGYSQNDFKTPEEIEELKKEYPPIE